MLLKKKKWWLHTLTAVTSFYWILWPYCVLSFSSRDTRFTRYGWNSRTKCKMPVQQKVRLHCEAQWPAAFTFQACPLHRGPVQCPERPTGGHWGLHMQGTRKLPFSLRCGSPSLQGDCSADEGQKFCLRKASGLHQRAQESLWHVDPATAHRREGVAGSRSGSWGAGASQNYNLFLWFPDIVLASCGSKSKSLMILLSKANKQINMHYILTSWAFLSLTFWSFGE